MGKIKIWLLLPMIVLLVGCGKETAGEVEQAMAFRSTLLEADGCSFTGKITADYGNNVWEFTVDCHADGEGNLSFEVVEPEPIAGITGTVEAQGGKLTFDDKALGFGLLAENRISPVSCPYMVARSWCTGFISAAGYDDSGLRMTVETTFEERPLTVDTWLDQEKGVPIFSEVCYNRERILWMSISEFEFDT